MKFCMVNKNTKTEAYDHYVYKLSVKHNKKANNNDLTKLNGRNKIYK